MIESSPIQRIVDMSTGDGNDVLDVTSGWTKVRQVVRMGKPMSEGVRGMANQMSDVRHWVTDKTPHNRAEEGYIDDVHLVGISFPVE